MVLDSVFVFPNELLRYNQDIFMKEILSRRSVNYQKELLGTLLIPIFKRMRLVVLI